VCVGGWLAWIGCCCRTSAKVDAVFARIDSAAAAAAAAAAALLRARLLNQTLTFTSSLRYTLSLLGAARCFLQLRPPALRSIPCGRDGVQSGGAAGGHAAQSSAVCLRSNATAAAAHGLACPAPLPSCMKLCLLKTCFHCLCLCVRAACCFFTQTAAVLALRHHSARQRCIIASGCV